VSLAAGSRLGPYEILAPLGAGGMGEVYRARDTRLGREVAIKVLPPELSSDPERLLRFEQEARSASALNHPNIVTVYDVGRVDSTTYLAMELVEGRTVGELIAAGTIPVRRLLAVAAQVAEGLAKAHSAGIVHRDLKPENLMVSDDGFVKILDFGLAKFVESPLAPASRLPTQARPQTQSGTVLGTVGYMSPEQAAGQPLDFRSDHFSFGSILYEMATRKRAFERATAVDTLSAILHEEPEPIARVNSATPAPLRWIVERCLAKDSRERYASTVDLARDLASVREHISELSGGEAPLSPGTRPRRLAVSALIGAIGVLLLGLASGFLIWGRRVAPVEPRPLARLSMTFPADESPVQAESPVLALSPDGSRLVYVGRGPQGRRLYVRAMDRFEATPIPGTDGGLGPFFSPDGQWVGFWADRKLKKVSLTGGQPLTICDAAGFRGASWGTDGTILFSPYGNAPLLRVSEKGGEPKPATKLDPQKREFTHRWPRILPGGKAAIFTIHGATGNYDSARIALLMLETGKWRTLLEGGTDARYVPTGHLVYLRAGSLFAVPFDLGRLEVTGPPVPVLDGMNFHGGAGFAFYDFSAAGSLVYMPLDPKQREAELVWVDRKGAATPLTGVKRAYQGLRLSPDGRRLAVFAGYSESDIWILDLTRGSWDRLISGGINWAPVWSSDGERLAFGSNRNGPINTFWTPIDRGSPPEQLTKAETWTSPLSWSPDGRTLLIEQQLAATGFDVLLLSRDGERALRPFLHTTANETDARFSPDGRWIAYGSDESGRNEVYVTAYPGPGGRSQVSIDGGSTPVWSHDGRELFYQSSGKMMAAAIETQPKFRAGLPKPLFELTNLDEYDVAPDGQRFVMIRTREEDAAPRTLSVVLNWFDDLKRRMSAQKK
jgi:serine/threonine protein kinase/Tol biopolymer transport system component